MANWIECNRIWLSANNPKRPIGIYVPYDYQSSVDHSANVIPNDPAIKTGPQNCPVPMRTWVTIDFNNGPRWNHSVGAEMMPDMPAGATHALLGGQFVITNLGSAQAHIWMAFRRPGDTISFTAHNRSMLCSAGLPGIRVGAGSIPVPLQDGKVEFAWSCEDASLNAPNVSALINLSLEGFFGFVAESGGGGSAEPGPPGLSAYQVALADGFSGTQTEWLASLKGEPGAPGAPGADGAPGTPGLDGRSAYQVALDNGYTGTEAEWLAGLKGEKGDKGDPGEPGAGVSGPVTLTLTGVLANSGA